MKKILLVILVLASYFSHADIELHDLVKIINSPEAKTDEKVKAIEKVGVFAGFRGPGGQVLRDIFKDTKMPKEMRSEALNQIYSAKVVAAMPELLYVLSLYPANKEFVTESLVVIKELGLPDAYDALIEFLNKEHLFHNTSRRLLKRWEQLEDQKRLRLLFLIWKRNYQEEYL